MRSLPIAVLFSLVSLVAAFSKSGHTLRNVHMHARKSGCNSTAAVGNKNQTDLMQNQTASTPGTPTQPAMGRNVYQLVDQYKGKDFLDET